MEEYFQIINYEESGLGVKTANGTKKDTTTGNTSTSIYSPQTGDTTDLSGYVITLIASVTVITGWLILRKKKME